MISTVDPWAVFHTCFDLTHLALTVYLGLLYCWNLVNPYPSLFLNLV